ncbi:RNA polymerase sigma factor RpoH [Candidatus Magnetaquicoccaceae bacterium FCR-1]|uniref:RNA polymerase sigma factor RpoH n=1 Tax=Candidatus Magnetaquiglobus chichijimensis TaxID=3141448 RepID=A0ABQ0C8M1_9PROT
MTAYPVALHRSSELTRAEGGDSFRQFVRHAFQAPILTAEEEQELATRFKRDNDLDAAHQLVHAYLRLVLKIAREYGNYHLHMPDLVQEGTVGLMHAVKKFDPSLGNRLSSYAVWWIRASIHEFILNSWRMVKIATTQLKRQLFFKLRQAKDSSLPLNWEEAEELARKFGTDPSTILEMDGRMSGSDTSLNQSILEEDGEIIDLIPDRRPNQEHLCIAHEQKNRQRDMLRQGLNHLNPRERMIITERFLSERQQTLDTLSTTLAISRERVRQIEKRALEKLKAFMESLPDGRELALETV